MITAQHRRVILWTLTGLLTVLFILITPFLLEGVAPSSKDWQKLSNISQAYGALSVFFSAAALLGVVASLAHQSRQTEVSIEQAIRASHQNVIELVLSDPDLMAGGEPPPVEMTQRQARQAILANLFVSNWLATYRLNRMTDDALRVLLAHHFKGEVPRLHWAAAGEHWQQLASASKARKEVRFVSIVNEMYRQAVSQGPPTPASSYFSANA
ncbi:DUF6082 family protein [Streptomyces sp. NPDC090088]|uniref:DUF6082 family protein n=1 Tax=Streptomyces sp. NPDC090088 TaxID=3365944 RepID=UPI00382DDAB4